MRSKNPASTARESVIVSTLIEMNGADMPPNLQRLLDSAPESFDDLRLGAIAAAVRSLRAVGDPVSSVSVLELLADRKDAEGAALLLASLGEQDLPIALAELEAAPLWDAYRRRRMATTFGDAGEALAKNPEQADDVAAHVREVLDNLASDSIQAHEAQPIGRLMAPAADDANELLKRRYLCRGAGLLLVGQSGQGKSSLAMQMAVLWSLGRPCFGMQPAHALRVLLVQAENDDGDLYEMFNGICSGLQLSDDDKALAGQSILFRHEDARAGADFLRFTVAPLLRKHHPDLLILDPALAYIPGDTKDAEAVGDFLRRGLNPLLHQYGCAALIVHHTTKAKADGQQTTHDFLYAGAGSIEFTNWARAVLALETRGNGCYRLHAPKRGGRIGWVNEDGQPVFDAFLRHSRTPGMICWQAVDADEVESVTRTGKSKSNLLAHVPADGSIPQSVLFEKASAAGIGQKKARAFLDELVGDGALHVWLIQRRGTNPGKRISRHPQPDAELEAA